jgi:hypothetical protein
MSFLVNPYWYNTGCDPDVSAFLSATGITDATITSALCTLVLAMKANGTWAKCSAIYPMVGGTAATHKFNLKDPRDLDAAYRLLFSGGWVHSSNGAQPNGTNCFADTYVAGNVNTQNSSHLSYYSRSNTAGGVGVFKVDMGYLRLTPSVINNVIIIKRDNLSAGLINSATSSTTTTSLTNTQGFYLANRTTAILNTLWKNGVIVNSSADNSVAPSTTTNYLAARNSPDNPGVRNFSDRQCAFASIGAGFTNTEAANLYSVVQAFQTTLGRNV